MAKARTELGELKGYSAALPNPMLLLSPAILRESIASSDIENVNTTVERALQQQLFPEVEQRPADKEVLRYGQAMRWGFEQLPTLSLSSRLIVGIQRQREESCAGWQILQLYRTCGAYNQAHDNRQLLNAKGVLDVQCGGQTDYTTRHSVVCQRDHSQHCHHRRRR